MSRSPTVLIDDVVLAGAGSYGWSLTSGARPHERVFLVTEHVHEQLRPRLGADVTLTIRGDDEERQQRFERLTLLEIGPGDTPRTRRLRIADRRWRLPRRWVAATYNERRVSTDRYLVQPNRPENVVLQPEVRYSEPTLNFGRPWTAERVLRDVFRHLGVFSSSLVLPASMPRVEINDLVIDDQGADALERVLAYLPGMDVYVDARGRFVVYDTLGGGESEVLDRSPPPRVGGGLVTVMDKSAIRPRAVDVLFTREIELRLDAGEGQVTVPTPALSNVLPVPDIELTIRPVGAARARVARGSLVRMDEAFSAWGPFGFLSQPISFNALRRHAFLDGQESFAHIWSVASRNLLHPDPVLVARAHAALASWRTLYRMARGIADRFAAIRAFRASLLNPVTGAYAPAEVYCDWVRRPSIKGLMVSLTEPNDAAGWAVRGWADDLTDMQPAPARVEVLDEANGVLRIAPNMPHLGEAQAMAFGYPEGGALPSQDRGKANRLGVELHGFWNRVVLERDFRLAVILTVVPAFPNTTERFLRLRVPAPPGLGESRGPVTTVRVFPGVMTARYRWEDGRRSELVGAVLGNRDEAALPDDLLLNGTLVRDVAQAAAARVYAALTDRPQGSLTTALVPGLEPAGTVDSVGHEMRGGSLQTETTFRAARQVADLWRFLDASTRQVILRDLNAPWGTG